ncbi:MAG: Na/Pi symporter [Campylobacter sp.]|nr:Na/Pi symporter [Campylobacter sp.]
MIIAFGIALFLYAMSLLEQSLGLMANIDKFVKKLTDKNHKSFFFGLIATCLAQSSGLVSLIAISFASAGLITLAAGLCIIYGANLGTTTGAWIIAAFGMKVDIAKYAMPMVIFGAYNC